ncbi:hypothetical protein RR46_00908 [Papilio xuthus]|uniref:Uncharacterized protein n=1 Tax=Papilio xuthus TaxID=66420 RepID=A0A0N1PEA4_PAPXU|nr:hypothetical protein RR46_00908 [Papilio xuthus]
MTCGRGALDAAARAPSGGRGGRAGSARRGVCRRAAPPLAARRGARYVTARAGAGARLSADGCRLQPMDRWFIRNALAVGRRMPPPPPPPPRTSFDFQLNSTNTYNDERKLIQKSSFDR